MNKTSSLKTRLPPILAVVLLALFCIAGQTDPAELPPRPKIELPPLDGVKHGATREVFDKLVQDWRTRPYQLARYRDGSLADHMNGHCMELFNAMRSGVVSYIEPKINTDDYDDPRFDEYKKKYREAAAISNHTWKDVPGADWFGSGIRVDKGLLIYPTRNFALYELDLDGDDVDEVIFYGEFGVSDFGSVLGEPLGNPKNYADLFPFGYKIYKNYDGVDGVSVMPEYDNQNQRHNDNYSIIFKYKDKSYVAVSSIGDHINTTIYRLGLTMGTRIKPIYTWKSCAFSDGAY